MPHRFIYFFKVLWSLLSSPNINFYPSRTINLNKTSSCAVRHTHTQKKKKKKKKIEKNV